MDWADDDDSDNDKKQAQGEGKPKRPVRLLDYACGTGTISRVIAAPDFACVSSPVCRPGYYLCSPVFCCPLAVSMIMVVLTSDAGKQALAPYTTQCVGIDLSEGMISAYNTRAENQVCPSGPQFQFVGACSLTSELRASLAKRCLPTRATSATQTTKAQPRFPAQSSTTST